jgi:hypothetical protein
MKQEKKQRIGLFLGAVFGGVCVFLVQRGELLAAPVRIELPQEVPVLKSGPGREIAMSQCLICHSAEYFTTQPPLPRAYWQGAVEKMQAKFGAAIPPEQVPPLVEYLFGNYGKKP